MRKTSLSGFADVVCFNSGKAYAQCSKQGV